MPIQPAKLFNENPGEIPGFGSISSADIFNQTVVPQMDRLSGVGVGAAASAQLNMQAASNNAAALLDPRQDADPFSAPQLIQPATDSPGAQQFAAQGGVNPPPASSEPLGAQVRDSTIRGGNLTDMVKNFEAGSGFRAKAYEDFGQHSIGFGTKAKPGEVIDEAEANRRLASELGQHQTKVKAQAAKWGYDLKPNQLDALTSFSFNVGSINQLTDNGKRDLDTVGKKILLYNKAGGKRLPGLVNRRAAESKLFFQGYGS